MGPLMQIEFLLWAVHFAIICADYLQHPVHCSHNTASELKYVQSPINHSYCFSLYMSLYKLHTFQLISVNISLFPYISVESFQLEIIPRFPSLTSHDRCRESFCPLCNPRYKSSLYGNAAVCRSPALWVAWSSDPPCRSRAADPGRRRGDP